MSGRSLFVWFESRPGRAKTLKIGPASGVKQIADLCEVSDLLLFVTYFAYQSKGIKCGDCFIGVCCAN